jgi:nicotinamidase-related amidase
MNDGNREEGFLKKVLDCDISMFQSIENNLIQLVSACKAASIPVACVTSIYDFEYISVAMRSRLEAMGIRGEMDPKGAWGSQIIAELLALDPDYILVKSHYSAFSRLHSFIYKPGTNKALEDYLRLPAEDDENVKLQGGKTMHDYFQEADDPQIDSIDQHLNSGGVASFEGLLRQKGIQTLIITGGSTHVCEDAAVSGASERGYEIIEPLDAVASEDADKHFVYLHNHGLFKTQLTTTQKILEALKAR